MSPQHRKLLANLEDGLPHCAVENWLKDVMAGEDPQLERAVQEAMQRLKQRPGEPHEQ